MATITGFSSSLYSICSTQSHLPSSSSSSSSSHSLSIPFRAIRLQSRGTVAYGGSPTLAQIVNKNKCQRWRKIVRSVAEETLVPEEAEVSTSNNTEQTSESEASTTDQPVSVPVSPSDILTMFFQAEGTMNETAIPAVTTALEDVDGISNLKVQVVEGIASVELRKQTTVQATGVASNLVEVIQGSGFKLQTLNLSFEDEEDAI